MFRAEKLSILYPSVDVSGKNIKQYRLLLYRSSMYLHQKMGDFAQSASLCRCGRTYAKQIEQFIYQFGRISHLTCDTVIPVIQGRLLLYCCYTQVWNKIADLAQSASLCHIERTYARLQQTIVCMSDKSCLYSVCNLLLLWKNIC